MALACRFGLLSSVPTSSRKGNPRRLVCSATPQDGRGSPSEPLGLPGGGVWLGRSQGSFLYGSHFSFLLRRDPVGGEGLIVRRQQPKPVRVQRQAAVPIPSPANQGAGLSLVGLDISSCSVVIDTEFELLEEQQQQPPAAIQPNTTCTGIVPVSLGVEAAEEELSASKHPRRTQRVSFSCNLCGTGNIKDTNPHAWAHGSVFMRCEGCGVVHKLKDNLNIFHELRGPIFPPRHMRNSFLVQEVLDKIKEKNARRRQQGSAEGGDQLGN